MRKKHRVRGAHVIAVESRAALRVLADTNGCEHQAKSLGSGELMGSGSGCFACSNRGSYHVHAA